MLASLLFAIQLAAYQPLASIQRPNPGKADRQRHIRALLVGEGKYQDPSLPKFFGDRDPSVLKQAIQSRYKVSDENIHVILNGTRSQILAEFSHWFIDGSSPNDQLLFYFSGHGGKDADGSGTLVPVDSRQLGQSFSNLIPIGEFNKDIVRLLQKGAKSRLTMVFDTSQEARLVPGPHRFSRGAPSLLSESDLQDAIPSGRVSVITASQPGEQAYDSSDTRHGILTSGLAKSIEEAGSLPTYGDLMGRTQAYISQMLEGLQQHPQFFGDKNRVLFSDERRVDQPYLYVVVQDGKLRLNAGLAQGLSRGERFALFPQGPDHLYRVSPVEATIMDLDDEEAHLSVNSLGTKDLGKLEEARAELAAPAAADRIKIALLGENKAGPPMINWLPAFAQKVPLNQAAFIAVAPDRQMPKPSKAWLKKYGSLFGSTDSFTPVSKRIVLYNQSGEIVSSHVSNSSSGELKGWLERSLDVSYERRRLIDLGPGNSNFSLIPELVPVVTESVGTGRIVTHFEEEKPVPDGRVRETAYYAIRVAVKGAGNALGSAGPFVSVFQSSFTRAPEICWPGKQNLFPDDTRLPLDGSWSYLGVHGELTNGSDLSELATFAVGGSANDLFKVIATMDATGADRLLTALKSPFAASVPHVSDSRKPAAHSLLLTPRIARLNGPLATYVSNLETPPPHRRGIRQYSHWATATLWKHPALVLASSTEEDSTISMTYPTTRAEEVTVAEELIPAKFDIGGDVANCTVNGQPASFDPSSKNWVVNLRLTPGQNKIRVVAKRANGESFAREFVIVRKDQSAPIIAKFGQNYALVIGCGDYAHYPHLNNPVADASALAAELQDRYGYSHVELMPNPTRKGLQDALDRYQEMHFQPEDELLIFFAGHGLAEGRRGYLILSDSQPLATDSDRGSLYDHRLLSDDIDNIHCKHILLILDSCHSGVFMESQLPPDLGAEDSQDLWASLGMPSPEDEAMIGELVNEHLATTVREFMTSGNDQVSDGFPGKHSPFMQRLLGELTLGEKRGYVFFSNLKADLPFVDSHVVRASGFGHNAGPGEFVFLPRQR